MYAPYDPLKRYTYDSDDDSALPSAEERQQQQQAEAAEEEANQQQQEQEQESSSSPVTHVRNDDESDDDDDSLSMSTIQDAQPLPGDRNYYYKYIEINGKYTEVPFTYDEKKAFKRHGIRPEGALNGYDDNDGDDSPSAPAQPELSSCGVPTEVSIQGSPDSKSASASVATGTPFSPLRIADQNQSAVPVSSGDQKLAAAALPPPLKKQDPQSSDDQKTPALMDRKQPAVSWADQKAAPASTSDDADVVKSEQDELERLRLEDVGWEKEMVVLEGKAEYMEKYGVKTHHTVNYRTGLLLMPPLEGETQHRDVPVHLIKGGDGGYKVNAKPSECEEVGRLAMKTLYDGTHPHYEPDGFQKQDADGNLKGKELNKDPRKDFKAFYMILSATIHPCCNPFAKSVWKTHHEQLLEACKENLNGFKNRRLLAQGETDRKRITDERKYTFDFGSRGPRMIRMDSGMRCTFLAPALLAAPPVAVAPGAQAAASAPNDDKTTDALMAATDTLKEMATVTKAATTAATAASTAATAASTAATAAATAATTASNVLDKQLDKKDKTIQKQEDEIKQLRDTVAKQQQQQQQHPPLELDNVRSNLDGALGSTTVTPMTTTTTAGTTTTTTTAAAAAATATATATPQVAGSGQGANMGETKEEAVPSKFDGMFDKMPPKSENAKGLVVYEKKNPYLHYRILRYGGESGKLQTYELQNLDNDEVIPGAPRQQRNLRVSNFHQQQQHARGTWKCM